MNSKECELQLNQLIIDWDEDRATRLNATDIEAIKHLMLENQMQHNEINKLKHILDELEKWLEEIQQEEFDINGFTGVCTEIRIQCILDKIKELRGRE